ncbi:MAG: hypothetical protein A3E83_00330 [Gammaproteobacteria bacterium RIFCSPHIGHO2_12_FULL_41_20]|nr:MAG: hypothetical protein A3E83_00330 [Gammaproteobacteria bacterium RIFCSPHIGHO2_12_FULL_41_20]
MPEVVVISYVISDLIELNLSYMPFINEGGLFIPTSQSFQLGDKIIVNLQLPGEKETIKIEGKVVWITPQNALHHVSAGIGIQFIGPNAQNTRNYIEGQLDKSIDVGGYTYGVTGDVKEEKK